MEIAVNVRSMYFRIRVRTYMLFVFTPHVSQDRLREIGSKLTELPPGFTVHKQLEKILAGRKKSIEEGQGQFALPLYHLLSYSIKLRLDTFFFVGCRY